MSTERESGGSPFGCAGCILTILLLWALAFGVTWGGVKREIKCSCDRGVEVTP